MGCYSESDNPAMNFAQQNTERAVQATNWMCAIAEQNINQSKAAFENDVRSEAFCVGLVGSSADHGRFEPLWSAKLRAALFCQSKRQEHVGSRSLI
jgi:hypothetical protein